MLTYKWKPPTLSQPEPVRFTENTREYFLLGGKLKVPAWPGGTNHAGISHADSNPRGMRHTPFLPEGVLGARFIPGQLGLSGMSRGEHRWSRVSVVARCSTAAAQRSTRLRLLPAATRACHISHHFLLHKKALFAAGLPCAAVSSLIHAIQGIVFLVVVFLFLSPPLLPGGN